MMDIFECCSSAFMNCIFFFTSFFNFLVLLDESSEFSQSEVEGLHQEGEKSTQTGPDKQLQTNDFAPVS